MSSNNNNISKNVSNIDIPKIQQTIEEENDEKFAYKYFCEKYILGNFERKSIDELKMIYDNGKGLLDQYYITQETSCEKEIMQLQYIINQITYNLNLKNFQEAEKINKRINSTIKKVENVSKETDKRAKEIKHLKNDVKSITTTIISIILAISIIPTAIAGIEKISPNYILPFLSSVILFGIIMITFVYSIYQDKLKISTWVILVVSLLICSIMWGSTFFINIDKNINKENAEEENIIEEKFN